MISIIIPTLNEAARIPALLRHTAALAGAKEILVVDGGSADGTPGIVETFRRNVSTVMANVRLLRAERGRAGQMNAGAAQARGEALLFLHADTLLPPGALGDVERALAGGAAWGAFAMRFDAPGLIYRLMERGNNARSPRYVTGDQAIFVRADAFRQVGGYPALALMEDLALCRALAPIGAPAILRPPVLVSARRHRQHGALRVLAHGWLMQLRWRYAGAREEQLRREYPDVR
jgi:rSAM/selenodomain-associated transferase 2